MSAPVVVVGASLAGLRAVQALRAQGHDGHVVVVGDEVHLPYERTQMSKGWLDGSRTLADVLLVDPADLEALGTEWRLGVRAVGLRVADGVVPLRVLLAGGEEIPAAGVVVATGARARTLPDQFGPTHVLRNVADATALRQQLLTGRRVTVVGGGLIGAEVAAKAVDMGCEVTVLDVAPDVFTRQFGSLLGRRLRAQHDEHGVRILLGRRLERRSENVLVLHDGTELPTDVLVAGIGRGVPARECCASSQATWRRTASRLWRR